MFKHRHLLKAIVACAATVLVVGALVSLNVSNHNVSALGGGFNIEQLSESYDRVECEYTLSDYTLADFEAYANSSIYPSTPANGSCVILCQTATFATDHSYHYAKYNEGTWTLQTDTATYSTIMPHAANWYVVGTVKSGIAAMYFQDFQIATANGAILGSVVPYTTPDNITYVGSTITDAVSNKIAVVVTPKEGLGFSDIILNNMGISYSNKQSGANQVLSQFLSDISFRTLMAGDPLLTSVSGAQVGDGVIEFTAFQGMEIGTKGQSGYAYFEFPLANANLNTQFSFYRSNFNHLSFYVVEDIDWNNRLGYVYVPVSINLNGKTFKMCDWNVFNEGSSLSVYDSGTDGTLVVKGSGWTGINFETGTECNIYGGTFSLVNSTRDLFCSGDYSKVRTFTMNIYDGNFSADGGSILYFRNVNADIHIYKGTFSCGENAEEIIYFMGANDSTLLLDEVSITSNSVDTSPVNCKNVTINMTEKATINSYRQDGAAILLSACTIDLKGTVNNLYATTVGDSAYLSAIHTPYYWANEDQQSIINLYASATLTSVQGATFLIGDKSQIVVKETLTKTYTLYCGEDESEEKDLIVDYVTTNPTGDYKTTFTLLQYPTGLPFFFSYDSATDCISSKKFAITKDATDADRSITTNSGDATYQWYTAQKNTLKLEKGTHFTEEDNTDYSISGNSACIYQGQGAYKGNCEYGNLCIVFTQDLTEIRIVYSKDDLVFKDYIALVSKEPFSISATQGGAPLTLDNAAILYDLGAYDAGTGMFSSVYDDYGSYCLYVQANTTGTIICQTDNDILIDSFSTDDLGSDKSYGISFEYFYGTILITDDGVHYENQVAGETTATLTTATPGTYACQTTLYGRSLYSSMVTVTAPTPTPDPTPAKKTVSDVVVDPIAFDFGAEAESVSVTSALQGFMVLYNVDGAWVTEMPTNAGTYDVKITRPEDSTYKAYTQVFDGALVINKAQAFIEVDTTDIVVTYGDKWTLPKATTNFGEVSVDYGLSSFPVEAGKYTITYTVEGTENYEGDIKTICVIINKKVVSEPTVVGTYIADGTEKKVVLEGLVDGMKPQPKDSYIHTEPGQYTITFLLSRNYTWAEGSDGIVFWTIEEAPKTSPWVWIAIGLGGFIIIIFGLFLIWKKEFNKALKKDTLEKRVLKFLDPIYRPINKAIFGEEKKE